MGEKLRKILMGLVVIILSYLLVANILHMISLNEKQEILVKTDNETTSIIKEDYNKLENNIEKLRTIKRTNNLDEEEYKKILNTLEKSFKNVKDTNVINIDFDKSYKDRDVYELLAQYSKLNINADIINAYDVIINSDSNSGFDRSRIINEYLMVLFNLSTVQNRLMNNYHYRPITNDLFTVSGIEVESIHVNTGRKITILRALSDYLVKDGGLSE